MKRYIIVAILLVAAGSLFAQSIPDFNAFKGDVQTFANSIASSLPLESSVGLNWSDAYIGQFPHFGLGLTVGAATIPFSAVKTLVTEFGGSVSGFSSLQSIGVPVPAYTLDVRIGGFVLPFDIGLKFGYVPENAFSTSSVKADYLLLGGDVRYGLSKREGLHSQHLRRSRVYLHEGKCIRPHRRRNGHARSGQRPPEWRYPYLHFSEPDVELFLEYKRDRCQSTGQQESLYHNAIYRPWRIVRDF